MSGNKPNLKSGSWNANGAVRSAESELNFRKLRGPTQFGRAGIGTTSHKSIPNDKHSREYRKLISKTSIEIDEENPIFNHSVQVPQLSNSHVCQSQLVQQSGDSDRFD